MSGARGVGVLLGPENADLASVLSELSQLPAWRPFDERVVDFVGKLSQKMLRSREIKNFPELAALAHWFRKARLIEMGRKYGVSERGLARFGRGLAFHLAPSNVDSVFMYSWLISLLAGNANLVRVSQKGGRQQEFLIDVLAEMRSLPEFFAVSSRFVLLTYPHDRAITQQISEACMIRVVWGGDDTVREVRSIPLRPMAIELCFADRLSIAALDSRAVLNADDDAFNTLVRGFYNDAFLFAQQACSSPRLVVWVGPAGAVSAAKSRFWPALADELARQGTENFPAQLMARIGATFQYAAAGLAAKNESSRISDHPAILDLCEFDLQKIREIHCGNGLFLQAGVRSLAELGMYLTDREQTLAVFGFQDKDYLDLMGAIVPRALDRIVNVGSALTFDAVWDGQDLFVSFSRAIRWPAHA